MNISRRGALGSLASMLASPSWAQTQDDRFPILPPILGGDMVKDFSGTGSLGSVTPPGEFFEIALALAEKAPFNCPPIDVALYWRGIGIGVFPKLDSPAMQRNLSPAFVRGWPHYYNPVITNFFKVTGFDPKAEGDGTAWCAAFVNWCIARGGASSRHLDALNKNVGTGSPSSGSFRCWHTATKVPARGDVVVWAKEGTVKGCAQGQGHVAFFLESAANGRMLVVGGNQRDPSTITGATQSAVCQKTFPNRFLIARKGGSYYKTLHSYRSMKG